MRSIKMHIDPVIGLTEWQARELVYRAEPRPGDGPQASAAALLQLYAGVRRPGLRPGRGQPAHPHRRRRGDGARQQGDASTRTASSGTPTSRTSGPTSPRTRSRRWPGNATSTSSNSTARSASSATAPDWSCRPSTWCRWSGAPPPTSSTWEAAPAPRPSATRSTCSPGTRRCKAVLINIFGGITRCDLVAQGIVEALGSLELPWPIVVRLDGTNAEEGRAILAEAAIGEGGPGGDHAGSGREGRRVGGRGLRWRSTSMSPPDWSSRA